MRGSTSWPTTRRPRGSPSIAKVDERTLREVYLAPFEVAVREAAVLDRDGGVQRGQRHHDDRVSRCCRDVLQDEWGFDGVTMTDWFAGRSLEPSANAALDLCMPGPWSPWALGLVDAVLDGRVAEPWSTTRCRVS